MRVADTSFLYAAFDAADERHAEAKGELARPEAVLVPLAVMAELLDLVAYRNGRQAAEHVREDLASLGNVVIHRLQDEDEALSLWHREPRLSAMDAIGVRAALETGAGLLTYDADQQRAVDARRT